jgi:polyisoprenoid-binding protein YceI
MMVHVAKQGIFSMFADNHEIAAPIASGSYDDTLNTVQLSVNADQMRVLDPSLPAKRRGDVQETMAGPKVLDVERYRTISFNSTKIDQADPSHWTITGMLTLHGQSHPITFAVQRADATHFSGSATIRQSDFGITPLRLAGGAVAVRDEVRIDFQIALDA